MADDVPPPGGGSETIGVFARLKPSKTEPANITVADRFGKQKSVQCESDITKKSLEFTLDWIFKPDESQEEIYAHAGVDRVEAVLAGFNATLLCYGQTGAGKSALRALELTTLNKDPRSLCFKHGSAKPVHCVNVLYASHCAQRTRCSDRMR